MPLVLRAATPMSRQQRVPSTSAQAPSGFANGMAKRYLALDDEIRHKIAIDAFLSLTVHRRP